eukprot:1674970-Amphidinium_carterae.1
MRASGVQHWQHADATDQSLRPWTEVPKCENWLSLKGARSEVAGAAVVASKRIQQSVHGQEEVAVKTAAALRGGGITLPSLPCKDLVDDHLIPLQLSNNALSINDASAPTKHVQGLCVHRLIVKVSEECSSPAKFARACDFLRRASGDDQ